LRRKRSEKKERARKMKAEKELQMNNIIAPKISAERES